MTNQREAIKSIAVDELESDPILTGGEDGDERDDEIDENEDDEDNDAPESDEDSAGDL